MEESLDNVIPSGLTEESISLLDLLPEELQCTILGYSLDLTTLLALLETSKHYHDLVKACLTTLVPHNPPGYSRQEVTVDFILMLPQLVRCDYFIKVRTFQELKSLTNHPKLRYASLNVDDLADERIFD